MTLNLNSNSNKCEICLRLQTIPDGTAPNTINNFIQPTMYDHMVPYYCYKHRQEMEMAIERRKRELLIQDEKFTNYKPVMVNNECKSIDECLLNFTTQDLVKFEKDLSLGIQTQIQPIPLATIRSKSAESLINISRSPVKCPVTSCNKFIGFTSILAHFICDHHRSFVVEIQDIEGDGRAILTFDEEIFVYGENICLGILVYGGINSDKESRPGICGLCCSNSLLSEEHHNLVNHLPILILGCKTRIDVFGTDDNDVDGGVDEVKEENNPLKHIIMFWLVSIETTRPIYSTVSIFNHKMKAARSSVIKIRDIKATQNVKKLQEDTNFIMLGRGDINCLSNQGKTRIEIEFTIKE